MAASVGIRGMYGLIQKIQDIEKALGDGVKQIYESELGSLRKLRNNSRNSLKIENVA